MELYTPTNRYSNAVELGGRMIRSAYKRYGEMSLEKQRNRTIKKPKTSSNKNMSKSKSTGGYGSGFYKGKFSAAKAVNTTEYDKALTKGAASSWETYGSCSGTEIVWVGATTINTTQLARNVSIAILRKLFVKAGIDITNGDIALGVQFLYGGAGSTDGFGFVVVRTLVDPTGNLTLTSYTTVAGETMNSLINNCGLVSEITSFIECSSSLISKEVRLYANDIGATGPASVGRLVATVNLNNETIHVNMSTKLVVQNRTKAASGTTDALDVIDAQPLKGMIYHFKKSNPVVREVQNVQAAPNTESLLGRWQSATGSSAVKLVSDASVGYDAQMRNPPRPAFFANCDKAASISLEPGDLKEVVISNSVVKLYDKFIRSLASFSTVGLRRQTVADCVFVCLEERLNSGSANPIKVQYEAETTISAYLTSGKVNPLQPTFLTTVYNL